MSPVTIWNKRHSSKQVLLAHTLEKRVFGAATFKGL